ncbi:Mpo1-like protein [Thalassotalea ganghwensis]
MSKRYQNFQAFYPFYLEQHQNKYCRRLHFVGSLLVLSTLLYVLLTKWWFGLILLPFIGYGFAWIGHFFFEKNKPATFTYPLYSLLGDWVMFKDILLKKIPW